jgi:dCMP deaminase
MSKNSRPTIDEYFMQLAKDVSTRSTCLRRQIGAVLVIDKQMQSAGYNGTPKGLEHCSIKGCIRDQNNIPSGEQLEKCYAVHSEMNAIIQCAVHGKTCKNATLYVTVAPCRYCARMVINAEIQRVVFVGDYSHDEGLKLLREANIIVDRLEV